ncbi:MAG: serine hydrolase [Pseudomonadota bacterium]
MLLLFAAMGAAIYFLSTLTVLYDIDRAGYRAIFACSSTFISGRSLEQIEAFELTESAFDLPIRVSKTFPIAIDREMRTASVPFDPSRPPVRAGFREGIGCSLLPYGAPKSAVAKLPRLSKARPASDKGNDHWHDRGPLQAIPIEPDYADALASVVNGAFERDAYGEGVRTVGVVVIHRDHVVKEQYRDGFGPRIQYRTWSTAKSLTNAVIGVAIKDGVLPGVDSPALIPHWQTPADSRRTISLENLLHMASGLRTYYNEESGSRSFAAYWMGVDSAADAASLESLHPAGSVWHYSNYDTLLLLLSLKTALGDDQAYLDFPYERLFDRIGMHDTFAETDSAGNYLMSSQVYTTARDLARFGYLYLQDGIWGSERILPEGWVDYSCTATTAKGDKRSVMYGAQWWLADIQFDASAGLKDLRLCYTSGARGQHMAFVPEHDLVIVRTGIDNMLGDGFSERQFFQDVIRAVAGNTSIAR